MCRASMLSGVRFGAYSRHFSIIRSANSSLTFSMLTGSPPGAYGMACQPYAVVIPGGAWLGSKYVMCPVPNETLEGIFPRAPRRGGRKLLERSQPTLTLSALLTFGSKSVPRWRGGFLQREVEAEQRPRRCLKSSTFWR